MKMTMTFRTVYTFIFYCGCNMRPDDLPHHESSDNASKNETKKSLKDASATSAYNKIGRCNI